MSTIAMVLRYELFFFLITLVVIVGYRMITKQINVEGLLLDKTSGRTFSPGRLQMLIVSMSVAIYYLMLIMDIKDTTRLPDMPNEFILALGGSHGIYLMGKLYGRFATTLGLASPNVKKRAKPKERETNK
jgi:hypothetical protein